MTLTIWLWVLLAIIIVVAGVFLYLAITVKRMQQRYEQLEERRQELAKTPIPEKLDEIKKMHLVGQSHTIFEKWEERWRDIHEDEDVIKADFEEITATIGKYSYVRHTKEYLDYLDARLNEWKNHLDEVMDGLQLLKESEKENSERVQASLDLMQALEKNVEENPTSFGIALGEVQKQLQHVQETFAKVGDLNNNGDPLEAAQLLRKAEKEVNAASVLFEAIPPLNQELAITYTEQLDDLYDGYRKLMDAQYKFPEDEEGTLKEQLQVLSEQISDAKEHLKRCDIDVVESENKRIHERIEHLYDVMQREVDAYEYVQSNSDTMFEYIEHAYKNNRQLTIELDHTSQSYVFHHNELGRTRVFQNEIEELQRDNNMWGAMLDRKEAIYTEVEHFYKEAFNILEDIENQQVEMDKTMATMKADYRKAEEAFDEFEFKMRSYKRYVEKHRLPGLPQEYLNYFFLVSEHIENLSSELAKVRVDTDKLNEYVDGIRNEVREVAQRTNHLIKDAMLAEQYMQYANRYRTTHDITPVINDSLTLFKEYRYPEAMRRIKSELSKIDPAAIDRIQEFYEEEAEEVE